MDRRLVAAAGTLALVAATEILAVYLADPFISSGLVLVAPDAGAGAGAGAGGGGTGGGTGGGGQAGSAGLWGLIPVVVGVALGTILVLALVRFDLDATLVRGVLFSSLAVAIGFVFHALLPVSLVGGVAIAVLVAGVAWVYPEWFVVDAVAVVAVAGVTALLGASLGPGIAIATLVAIAAYDAYSVYGSGHMATLADASTQLRAPTMFLVPTERGTSTRNLDGIGPDAPGGGNVAALGAGDALFPGVLVVVASRVGDPLLGPFSLPALGALLGTLLGLLGLQVYVDRNPGLHAGLPALNAATILGYLVGAVAAGVSLAAALGLG